MLIQIKLGAAAALFALASCQTTVGVGTGGSTGVAMTTTTGVARGGAFFSRADMRVVPDASDPGRFEVFGAAGSGGSDFWCSAGQYVIEHRRMKTGTRVYLERPIGPGISSSGKSVGFTVAPNAALKAKADAQSNGISMSTNRVGENWSAEHGRTQCPVLPFFFF